MLFVSCLQLSPCLMLSRPDYLPCEFATRQVDFCLKEKIVFSLILSLSSFFLDFVIVKLSLVEFFLGFVMARLGLDMNVKILQQKRSFPLGGPAVFYKTSNKICRVI